MLSSQTKRLRTLKKKNIKANTFMKKNVHTYSCFKVERIMFYCGAYNF